MRRSSLGECISSWLTGKENILIPLESYFDGSAQGDWRKEKLVTLAGYAADDSMWMTFDQEWDAILKDDRRRAAAPYLHMREATKYKDAFHYKNGWNSKRLSFLITDLLMYMQTIDKDRFRQFGCTIDLEAYRRLENQGFLFNDPIEICNDYCPAVALFWYFTEYPGIVHSAHFFFDIEEPFKELFEKHWKRQKANFLDPAANPDVWGLIKTVTTAEMRDKPAMQAADLLAWSSNRVHSVNAEVAFHDLEPLMKQIIPSTWIVFKEQQLRERYEEIKKGEHFRATPGRYGVY